MTQEVLRQPAEAAIFLVLDVRPGSEATARDLLADIAGLTRAVGFRAPEDELSCVVGIGASLWSRLYRSSAPRELHPFRSLSGARHSAPATHGDLLFHLRARRLDLCFELARHVMTRLAGHVKVLDEVQGFRYFDERDLLGFVDGTENPTGPKAVAAITVGDEDPAYAGGSYVVVQKYLHDLDAWQALPVAEQERVIGRSKLDDIEMTDAVKPANSHVAANTIVDPDGTERQIVRENMAFGSPGAAEFGTYFIGYAATPDVIERMLLRMFIGAPPGNYDRILDFSTAVTGSLFFVPTAEFLEDPSPATATNSPDGSLGIGSLKRSRT
ncbi:Dyp-type peroxidase [Kribbella kalugense]|uniref:Putative iron-dependent peroxidase n=1 Tax=Kribbella kalugense TaxID=2512221 RepID=A0A4R7Z9M9_9ACTN|nr:Dyp-type peroxidase [Kribbella kalugense]TDW14119.1 putative iron-dependent peroxidase [Kribbella kalugense]